MSGQRTFQRVASALGDPLALVNRQRAGLAKMVRDRIGGDEFAETHRQIWFTKGERWFSESDAIWRVHADAAMFVGGIRALLLQSLHPVAMLGVSEHSGYRSDPWGRPQRTSTYLATTTYGTVDDAERSIRIVRAIHGRVRGTTPEGEEYRADDPHLLNWVHLAEVDSFVTAYQAFGGEKLSPDQVDEYVRQSGSVAERLGVVDPPQTWAETQELLAAYRPELRSSPAAREAAQLLLRDPPITGAGRLGYGVLAAGAVSLLPAWVRSTLMLPTLPATDRLVVRPVVRSALATLRWALADPTGMPQPPA